MKIASDNAAIEKNLRYQEKMFDEFGGYIDPDLVIRCEGGSLGIEKQGFANPGKPLIALPGELLLPTEKLGLTVKGDDFILNAEKGALTQTQIKMAEAVVELYNLTGKIKLHKQFCPWFTFRGHKDLLDRLLAARHTNPALFPYRDFASNPDAPADVAQIACDLFIKTRTINHKFSLSEKELEAAAEIAEAEEPADKNAAKPRATADIMPIVDFMNHNTGGSFFSFRKNYDKMDESREFLLVGDSRPFPHTNECFAFYNQMDTVDSFIGYGFPYVYAPYIRSVPLEFDIPNTGRIKVHAMLSAMHKGKLAPNAAGLRPYIPHTVKNDGETMEITHLLIPTNVNAPQALRRVLRLLISNKAAAKRTLATNQIWDCVLAAEEKVIATNLAFYKDLLAYLDTPAVRGNKAAAAPTELLRLLAETQLTKLYKYNFDESHFGSADQDNDAPEKMAAAE